MSNSSTPSTPKFDRNFSTKSTFFTKFSKPQGEPQTAALPLIPLKTKQSLFGPSAEASPKNEGFGSPNQKAQILKNYQEEVVKLLEETFAARANIQNPLSEILPTKMSLSVFRAIFA